MPGPEWSQRDVRLLTIYLEQGFTPDKIQIGSRSVAAIRGKAARLKLIGDGVSRRPWSVENEQKLKTLMKSGWSVKRIAETGGVLPGYSRYAIAKKAGRLGLANEILSARAKRVVRFTPEQLRQFHQFLRERGSLYTPEQIALVWNKLYHPTVSRRRVIYHLVKLKIKPPWKEVILMPYSKAKQRRVSTKVLASRKRRWSKYRKGLLQHLRALSREMKNNSPRKTRLNQRVCQVCNKRWPAMSPFFLVSEKVTKNGHRSYTGRLCRLCSNRRRRASRRRRNRQP